MRFSYSKTVQEKQNGCPPEKWFYNKCWGDTTTVSLPTLFFCKK